MEKEYIVSLRADVDYDQFWNEMETNSPGLTFIPDRTVDIVNLRPGSTRCCHYALTDQEAEILKNDPRVLAVEIPPDQRDDIKIGYDAVQQADFTKSSSSVGSRINWGLLRAAFSTNIYGSGTSQGVYNYPYHLDGAGVDVVISDSGLQVDHPEFAGRVQQINWYDVANAYLTSIGQPTYSSTQNANHYRDYSGHGTHVAGITAGTNYGWAKGSRIYSIKVSGLEGPGDSGTGISISDSQDLIKLFHLGKPVDPVTGRKRPTVVNMSWGYSGARGTITSGVYRGTGWLASDGNSNSSTLRQNNYGIATEGNRVPVRVTSVDVDIDELVAAGVTVCIAAGNSPWKADLSTGTDYNNYYVDNYGTRYYHQGSSPHSSTKGCFRVGNLDSTTYSASLEKARYYSTRGPSTNIWVHGTAILSSTSNNPQGLINAGYSPATYFADGNYKQINIEGTSMASPQICGMIALYLQANPTATPEEAWNFMVNNSQPVIYSTGLDSDWSNGNSLWGSPNRMAYMPFAVDIGMKNTAQTTANLKR